MAGFNNVNFWEELIEEYKNLPELWNIKSDLYNNKTLKINGYNQLREKLCEIEENATVETVKRKLNFLRYCYWRELRKVRNYAKSGAGDLYVPTLWYFKKLQFLQDQECPLDDSSSVDVETENIRMEFTPQPKKRKRPLELQRSDLLKQAVNWLESDKKDDTNVLSDSWGTLYKKLDERQQLFANRAINEVLYQGALGNLNETSWKAFEKQHNPQAALSAVTTSSGTTLPVITSICLRSRSNKPISCDSDASHYSIVHPVPTRLTVARYTPES